MTPVAAVSVAFVGEKNIPHQPVGELLLSAAQLLPLLWRRVYPLPVFVVVSAVACVQIALRWPIVVADIGLLVALYTVSALRPLRFGVVAAVAASVGQVAWTLRYPNDAKPPALALLLMIIILAWVMGRYTHAKHLIVQGLRERAILAEETKERDACEAVIKERMSIARQLHDTVANHVSVMVVQAEGARLSMERDPGVAEKAMRQVVESGQAALSDMREMVAVMRQEASRPWSGRVDALIRRMRQAGLNLDLHVVGEPPGEWDALYEIVYALVREGLTNVLKHAGPGARANVRVAFGFGEVAVSVEDDGAGRRVNLATGGHGLDGLREQVSAWGGTLVTRPVRGGGYVVAARLPYQKEDEDAA